MSHLFTVTAFFSIEIKKRVPESNSFYISVHFRRFVILMDRPRRYLSVADAHGITAAAAMTVVHASGSCGPDPALRDVEVRTGSVSRCSKITVTSALSLQSDFQMAGASACNGSCTPASFHAVDNHFCCLLECPEELDCLWHNNRCPIFLDHLNSLWLGTCECTSPTFFFFFKTYFSKSPFAATGSASSCQGRLTPLLTPSICKEPTEEVTLISKNSCTAEQKNVCPMSGVESTLTSRCAWDSDQNNSDPKPSGEPKPKKKSCVSELP